MVLLDRVSMYELLMNAYLGFQLIDRLMFNSLGGDDEHSGGVPAGHRQHYGQLLEQRMKNRTAPTHVQKFKR